MLHHQKVHYHTTLDNPMERLHIPLDNLKQLLATLLNNLDLPHLTTQHNCFQEELHQRSLSRSPSIEFVTLHHYCL